MAGSFRRSVAAGMLVAAMAMSTTAVAAADTITQRFTGEGSSSFGFAFEYARWQAHGKAQAAGYVTPFDQCVEISSHGNVFWAEVVWECTREL
jgi:hypothetical protein